MRVHGCMPAERCVELLEQGLSEFGFSLKDDPVAICIGECYDTGG